MPLIVVIEVLKSYDPEENNKRLEQYVHVI